MTKQLYPNHSTGGISHVSRHWANRPCPSTTVWHPYAYLWYSSQTVLKSSKFQPLTILTVSMRRWNVSYGNWRCGTHCIQGCDLVVFQFNTAIYSDWRLMEVVSQWYTLILLSSYCHSTFIYDYTPCPICCHVHHGDTACSVTGASEKYI